MDGPRSRRPGRDELFLQDILDAPSELAAVIEAQRSAAARLPQDLAGCRRRRLIGMGSSGFAARDAAARWRHDGLDAVAEVASASAPSPGGAGTLAVVISASGRTPEVLAAAARHRDQGSTVVALTAEPASPLAAGADAVVPLRATAVETAGIACQTYRATVSGLVLLGVGRAAADAAAALSCAPAALAAFIDGRGAWLDAAATLLETGREVHVLADGLGSGLAEQAALMLREAPRIAALPFDTGDWLHVGQYTLYPGDGVLLFAGSPADDEAIATVHRRGGRVVAVGRPRDDADVAVPMAVGPDDWAVGALVAPAAAELVAAEIWARASGWERRDAG